MYMRNTPKVHILSTIRVFRFSIFGEIKPRPVMGVARQERKKREDGNLIALK